MSTICATCGWHLPRDHNLWHTRSDGEDACSEACASVTEPVVGQTAYRARRAQKAKRCAVAGCDRKYYGRGWCHAHYERWRCHGDPEWVAPRAPRECVPADQRFWQKVHKVSSGCWVWTDRPTPAGYGVLSDPSSDKRGDTLAHRFAYELLVEPIPDGLVLDHLCRNRLCVNPEHLEPVTLQENKRRGLVARGRSVPEHWIPRCARCDEALPDDHNEWHSGLDGSDVHEACCDDPACIVRSLAQAAATNPGLASVAAAVNALTESREP